MHAQIIYVDIVHVKDKGDNNWISSVDFRTPLVLRNKGINVGQKEDLIIYFSHHGLVRFVCLLFLVQFVVIVLLRIVWVIQGFSGQRTSD